MKVIFVKDLRGQGKINDIKDVSDGYAMNFLIKNGYAVKYTSGSVNRLNHELDVKAKQNASDIADAKVLEDALSKLDITFAVECGKDGRMFGTISSKQIHDELSKLGYVVDKKKIVIESPINSLGVHVVKLNLHKKVVCEMRIRVIRK